MLSSSAPSTSFMPGDNSFTPPCSLVFSSFFGWEVSPQIHDTISTKNRKTSSIAFSPPLDGVSLPINLSANCLPSFCHRSSLAGLIRYCSHTCSPAANRPSTSTSEDSGSINFFSLIGSSKNLYVRIGYASSLVKINSVPQSPYWSFGTSSGKLQA